MKLNADFILHDVGGEHMMVAVGKANRTFNGLVRSNNTAAYILELLKNETTESELVEKLLERYDAPQEKIEAGVAHVLTQLREIGALEE